MKEKKYRCYRCDALVGEEEKTCPNCGLDFESEEPVEMFDYDTETPNHLNYCQIAAIVIGIFGFVGGIILSYNSLEMEKTLFISWFVTIGTVIIMTGCGELIANTRDIKRYVELIYTASEKETYKKTNNEN